MYIGVLKLCVTIAAAADNIAGITLHSTQKLGRRCSQVKAHDITDSQVVEIFVIDEVSMIGVDVLYKIENSRRKLKGMDKDFRGLTTVETFTNSHQSRQTHCGIRN